MVDEYYLPSRQVDELRAMLSALPDCPGVLRLNCEIPNYPNFFPGGRGYKQRSFPESPVMFIGHNFDTDVGFRASVARGFEDHLRMKTWVNMKQSFLPFAGLEEEDCFFTNFYLGAIVHPEPKAGQERKTSNTGTFKCSSQYHAACINALRTQIDIVRPRVIALLGGNVPPAFAEAYPGYSRYWGANIAETQSKQPSGGIRMQLLPDLQVQVICLVHPANPRSTESHRAQGLLLQAAIYASAVKASGKLNVASEAWSPRNPVGPLSAKKEATKPESDFQVEAMKTMNQGERGVSDSWGFGIGTQPSYLLHALERGDKTKEHLQSDFAATFFPHLTYADAKEKSNFGVFFSDSKRPLGTYHASRSIIIQENSKGQLSLQVGRANQVKSAISKGVLNDLRGLHRTRDKAAIESVLDRYGLPIK